jgi:uncharacterized protein (DUF2344 family)
MIHNRFFTFIFSSTLHILAFTERTVNNTTFNIFFSPGFHIYYHLLRFSLIITLKTNYVTQLADKQANT